MQSPRSVLSVLGNRLETGRVVLYGVGIGALVGLVGTALAFALEAVQSVLLGSVTGLLPPGLPTDGGVLHSFFGDRAWLLPVVVMLGLLVTVVLERFGPIRILGRVPGGPVLARGDGVDAALDAYHNVSARVGVRTVLARTLAGLFTVGTGAPLGREGPFASLGSGIGAVFGDLGRLREEDRRLVFLVGLAAGLGLVLRAPIAAAVLAVEILYRRFEFEIEVLTPAVLSSVVAFAIFGAFRGFGPLFDVPNLTGQPPALLPAFFVLGLLEALAAAGFVAAFKGLNAAWAFTRLPLWIRLAIAGVAVGLIALVNPGVLGDGLGWSQLSLSGFLPVTTLLALLLWRALAVLLVASAGGAGGLIVPSLVIGGFIGNLYAQGLVAIGVDLEPAAFTLAGMAAFLAGTVNAPLAATLLITEWTGYGLLVPLLLTSIAGYLLTGGESVLSHQAESRSASPVHIAEYLRGAVRIATGNTVPVEPAVIVDTRSVKDTSETGPRLDLLDLLAAESLSVSDTDLERLYRMGVPEVWAGQAVRDLEWPAGSLLVAILREGHVRVPRGGTVLEPKDELIVMAEPEVFASLNLARARAGAEG